MEKKLEVNNLVISFRTPAGKVQAVRDISFQLNKGETLAIVGESGSGKSVTSKAILGILAGNSIVESGEIIYDGQDLLKISEEDFHKLRGDKISMIFQDPLSALNPIVKVGTQLTEAMLLKAFASRRKAKYSFNSKLALLQDNMCKATGNEAESKELCKTFDSFCIKSIRLEDNYNTIHRVAVELQIDIDEAVFLISKKQKVDVVKLANRIVKDIPKTVHSDIVVMSEEIMELVSNIRITAKTVRASAESKSQFVKSLQQLSAILNVAVSKTKPNYFTLGFYMMRNPTANVDDMDINELNEMTHKYLDDNFMNYFVDCASQAMRYHNDCLLEKKSEILAITDQLLEYFRQDTFNRKESIRNADRISALVEEAIDRLVVVKNGTEYTFAASFRSAIKSYFEGITRNPVEKQRFDKQTAQHQAIIAKGKTPEWQIVPPAYVDLELAKKNIRHILHKLRTSLRNDIGGKESFDAKGEVLKLIDYLKEQASCVVYKITHKMAKATALRLLDEVGIPEPAIRYKQYPFEFSGGMRQRIVIAIALASNPDILICDEPTTALDVTIQAQILELINKLKSERNLSVIFITHDLGVVANMADRIAVMYAGKIVEYGTCNEVFYDPRHPYTWALLSSMPDLDTKEKLESIPGTPPNMIYPPVGDAFAKRSKYAMEIDFEQQPPMFEITPTHSAATWLLHPDAPKVNPPKVIMDRLKKSKFNKGGSAQ